MTAMRLGQPSFAHLSCASKMAGRPEAAEAFLERLCGQLQVGVPLEEPLDGQLQVGMRAPKRLSNGSLVAL
jgi:hypothetical protein